MMASLVSSWKSQRHLDFKCPQCIFLILRPGILPEFLLRDWCHSSILFYKTGNLASFSTPPLCPGHYQVMSTFPSKYLWIFSVSSQTPSYPISFIYTVANASDWPSHFYFWTTNLSSHCSPISVENNNKKLDDISLKVSSKHFQIFRKSSLSKQWEHWQAFRKLTFSEF